MTKSLTQKQVKAYEDSLNCPFCEGAELEAGEIDPETLMEAVTCLSCGKEWFDTFSHRGIFYNGVDYDFKKKKRSRYDR